MGVVRNLGERLLWCTLLFNSATFLLQFRLWCWDTSMTTLYKHDRPGNTWAGAEEEVDYERRSTG